MKRRNPYHPIGCQCCEPRGPELAWSIIVDRAILRALPYAAAIGVLIWLVWIALP